MKEIHKIFSQLSISLTRKLSRQFIHPTSLLIHFLFVLPSIGHGCQGIRMSHQLNELISLAFDFAFFQHHVCNKKRSKQKFMLLASGHQRIRRFKVLSISPQTHNKAIGNSKLGKAKIIFQKLKNFLVILFRTRMSERHFKIFHTTDFYFIPKKYFFW